MSDAYDLVIVGAGASGLLAAVAARRLGLAVLVVESGDLAGGATATSSGTIWLPGNAQGSPGVADSPAEALRYLDAILGPTTDASTAERRSAYAATAGPLAQWLIASNIPLVALKDVPDHRPTAEGGKTQGRVLGVQPERRRPRGGWAEKLRSPDSGRRNRRTLSTRGEALSAELLHRAIANGVEFWFDCELVDLVEADGRVTGVVVRHEDADTEVTAARGVLLAAGGFAGNQQLREEYLPLPTDTSWTLHEFAASGQTLALAMAHGAAVAAMDDAWWVPVIVADGRAHRIDAARRAPHSVIVDSAGDRFFDEDAAPTDAVRRFYERCRTVRAVPCYLIMDDRHRRSVDLGPWKAGATPKAAVEAGEIVRADSLTDLAQAIDVDRAGLLGSVVRFNGFALKGKDLDFHRGESAWGRFGLAASKKRRNPGLGKLTKSPFWAVRVYPGDEGTKGGLLIDKNSRVLRPDQTAIEGLYACGGTAASIMARTSPGPGAALGEALIEAYRAVLDLSPARKPADDPEE